MYLLENVCENSNILEMIRFIIKILNIVFITAPIILIVFIIIDFVKGIVSGSENEMKKTLSTVLRRILYCVIIFFVPMTVNIIVNILGDLGVNYMDCITNATDDKIQNFKSLDESNIDYTTSQKSPNEISNKQTTSETKSKTKKVKFNLEREYITIGHYPRVVNSYKIMITNSKGKKMNKTNFIYESTNPAVVSVDSNGIVTAHFGGNAKINIALKKDPSNKKSLKVKVVHSIYLNVKLKKRVQGISKITGKKVILKKGTTGILNGIGYLPPKPGRKYNGYEAGDTIKTEDDYVSVNPIDLETTSYYKEKIYSTETVENFINLTGFESNTKYLFWTSHGTQMEYMFKGEKGKWKLYKQFYVNTGDAANQFTGGYATTGVHFNYTLTGMASNNQYHVNIGKRTPSGGWTNPWHAGGDRSRTPKSHGCTRFSSNDIGYLSSIFEKINGSRLIDF